MLSGPTGSFSNLTTSGGVVVAGTLTGATGFFTSLNCSSITDTGALSCTTLSCSGITNTGSLTCAGITSSGVVNANGGIKVNNYSLPLFNNGITTNGASVYIPVYFSGNTYSNVEIRGTFSLSAQTSIILSGYTTGNSAVAVTEAGETITTFNAQSTPTYTANGTVASNMPPYGLGGMFVMNMSNNLSSTYPRNYKNFQSTYTQNGVGATSARGMGQLPESSVSSPLNNIVLTPSSGTITMQWSTVHYY
jgi:hypothetical protein